MRLIVDVFLGFFKAFIPTILTYAILIGWAWMTWQVLQNAPPGKLGGPVTLKFSELPKVLGYLELGQRAGAKAAAAEHLLVSRQGNEIQFANKTQNKRVLLTTDRFAARFVERWELGEGDRISFPNADILVASLTRDRIVLRDLKTQREMAWEGTVAPKGEPVTEVCNGALRRGINTMKWLGRDFLTENKPEIRLFGIGGGVNCSDRWKLTGLASEAVYIGWQAGKFLVSPGSQRDQTLLIRRGQTRGQGFADIVAPFAGAYGTVQSLVVGISRYRVQAAADQITFTPISNRVFFFADELDPPNRQLLNWIGGGARIEEWALSRTFALTIGLAVAGGLFVLICFVWYQRKRPFTTLLLWIFGIVPFFLGLWVTGMLLQGAGNPDQSLMVYNAIAAWFWASFLLVFSGKLRGYSGWLWVFVTLLAGIGMTTLLQLGAGSDNTRWLRFFGNHALILALFGWSMALLAVVPDRQWRRLWYAVYTHERWFTLLALVLMGAMVMQFFMGNEEGLFGFQPVELVKMTFVTLLAFVGLHIAESRQREVSAYRNKPLAFLLPYIRMLAIFAMIVFAMVAGVRDFSPLIIMLSISVCWLWKVGSWRRDFSRARWLWWGIRPLIVLGIVAVAYGAYKVYEDPSRLPDSFPKKERVLVWAEPRFHPHTGAQVLGSMDFVGEAKWYGAKAWFGRNGGVMALPEVQNDFITAFLINRFGGFAGLLLLGVELIFVTLLFMLGGAIERHFGRGDFREQQLGTVLGFVIYGGACMYAAHWLISWGNVLGLLPVMGQPMTWVTAGTSHLVFFAMFTLTVALISGWVLCGYVDEVAASAMPMKEKE